jgi:hypothetical protein
VSLRAKFKWRRGGKNVSLGLKSYWVGYDCILLFCDFGKIVIPSPPDLENGGIKPV